MQVNKVLGKAGKEEENNKDRGERRDSVKMAVFGAAAVE